MCPETEHASGSTLMSDLHHRILPSLKSYHGQISPVIEKASAVPAGRQGASGADLPLWFLRKEGTCD